MAYSVPIKSTLLNSVFQHIDQWAYIITVSAVLLSASRESWLLIAGGCQGYKFSLQVKQFSSNSPGGQGGLSAGVPVIVNQCVLT